MGLIYKSTFRTFFFYINNLSIARCHATSSLSAPHIMWISKLFFPAALETLNWYREHCSENQNHNLEKKKNVNNYLRKNTNPDGKAFGWGLGGSLPTRGCSGGELVRLCVDRDHGFPHVASTDAYHCHHKGKQKLC